MPCSKNVGCYRISERRPKLYKVEYKLKKGHGAFIILTPTNAASPDDGTECRRATEEGKDGEGGCS